MVQSKFSSGSSLAEDQLRHAAREGRTLFCAWLTLNSPSLIDAIAEAGWDCLLIDQQHGLGGHDAMVECLTAAKAAGLPALVRVADNNPGLIGRALDAGAQAIVCPQIGSTEDAERLVRAVKYPPRGVRSWGPYRAQLGFSGDYAPQANAWTIACPQIETRGALGQLEEILSLDGVDMVCFGPNDLSADLTGRFDIHDEQIKTAMNLVREKCRENSVMSFAFANSADYARPLVNSGWDMIAVGTDAGWFLQRASETLNALVAPSSKG
jgi:4-hydroxy-2-oxoheptanedioate aldolase